MKAELNVKAVRYDQDEGRYISLRARPNFPVLGKRFGKRMKAMQARIVALAPEAIDAFERTGAITLDGEAFGPNDIEVLREARAGSGAISDSWISIDLACDLNEALVREGLAREVVNRLQRARKDMGFKVTDRVRVACAGDAEVMAALQAHGDYVAREVLAVQFGVGASALAADAPRADIDGRAFAYRIEKA